MTEKGRVLGCPVTKDCFEEQFGAELMKTFLLGKLAVSQVGMEFLCRGGMRGFLWLVCPKDMQRACLLLLDKAGEKMMEAALSTHQRFSNFQSLVSS